MVKQHIVVQEDQRRWMQSAAKSRLLPEVSSPHRNYFNNLQIKLVNKFINVLYSYSRSITKKYDRI